MLDPAPTTTIDPTLARGVLEEELPATATKPAMVVLGFHNTSYRLHLLPVGEMRPKFGGRVVGTIRAEAKRVDRVVTGGRYVEPVMGRPRRVQGRVVSVDEGANAIVVNAGMPIRCHLTDGRQRAGEFSAGDFVSFDVMRGATFEQSE